MGYSDGFNVASVGRAGGLSLWWDDSLKVKLWNPRNMLLMLGEAMLIPNTCFNSRKYT